MPTPLTAATTTTQTTCLSHMLASELVPEAHGGQIWSTKLGFGRLCAHCLPARHISRDLKMCWWLYHAHHTAFPLHDWGLRPPGYGEWLRIAMG